MAQPRLTKTERMPGERKVAAAWRCAAKACGLTDMQWSPAPLGQESWLEGSFGPLTVRVDFPKGRIRIAVLTSASPGQLSLAEGDEGRLSLVDEQGGQVSLADGHGDERNGQRRRTKS